jgi:hypothetical protein
VCTELRGPAENSIYSPVTEASVIRNTHAVQLKYFIMTKFFALNVSLYRL